MNQSSLMALGAALAITLAVSWSKPSTAADETAGAFVSSESQDVETALNVLFGKSKAMPYWQAQSLVHQMAVRGNLLAARADYVIWLAYPPRDPAQRISRVNAYFGARNLLQLSPTEQVELPSTQIVMEELKSLAAVTTFEYVEPTDSMTDERECDLTSTVTPGVALGLDKAGIYVAADSAVDLEAYARAGVRVDGNPAFFGLRPSVLSDREDFVRKLSEATARGLMTMDEAKRYVIEYDNKMAPLSRIYVAEVGSADMELLLRQLALGTTATLRIKPVRGPERVARIPLTVQVPGLGKSVDRELARHLQGPRAIAATADTFPMFDLYGYLYTTCAYGPLP